MEKKNSFSHTSHSSNLISPEKQKNLNEVKSIILDRINHFFLNLSSNFDYDLEVHKFIIDLNLENDKRYFSLLTLSLKKTARTEDDLKIITSYLLLTKNFIKLAEKESNQKKKYQLINNLMNLSSSLCCCNFPENYVILRFGDEGSTAYINLKGEADIIIKTEQTLNLTENKYLYYLANLIKYNEFGLLNKVINDNFATLPIEIIDDLGITTGTILNNKFRSSSLLPGLNKGANNNINSISKIKKRNSVIINKDIVTNKLSSKIENNNTNNNLNNINNLKTNQDEKCNSNIFDLNTKNNQIKLKTNTKKIKVRELLSKYKLKFLDKKTNHIVNNCDIDTYINRINRILQDIPKISYDKNLVTYKLKIYNYSKLLTLKKRSLFGEVALENSHSLRNYSIITSTDCYCVILNKKIFIDCMQNEAGNHLKNIFNFFIELPIFNEIPLSVFYRKYYSYLQKQKILKNKYIFNQGSKPEFICLLNKGIFNICTNMNMKEFTNFILFAINKLKNIVTENYYDKNLKQIYIDLLQNIAKEELLIKESTHFKNFYFEKIDFQIADVASPDLILYEELTDENENFVFSLRAKANDNIIYTLNNEIYKDLVESNKNAFKRHKILVRTKLELLIKRLSLIRMSKISAFNFHNAENDIGFIVSEELKEKKDLLNKQKSFLNFKTILNKDFTKSYWKNINKNNRKKNSYRNLSLLNILPNKNINQKEKLTIDYSLFFHDNDESNKANNNDEEKCSLRNIYGNKNIENRKEIKMKILLAELNKNMCLTNRMQPKRVLTTYTDYFSTSRKKNKMFKISYDQNLNQKYEPKHIVIYDYIWEDLKTKINTINSNDSEMHYIKSERNLNSFAESDKSNKNIIGNLRSHTTIEKSRNRIKNAKSNKFFKNVENDFVSKIPSNRRNVIKMKTIRRIKPLNFIKIKSKYNFLNKEKDIYCKRPETEREDYFYGREWNIKK